MKSSRNQQFNSQQTIDCQPNCSMAAPRRTSPSTIESTLTLAPLLQLNTGIHGTEWRLLVPEKYSQSTYSWLLAPPVANILTLAVNRDPIHLLPTSSAVLPGECVAGWMKVIIKLRRLLRLNFCSLSLSLCASQYHLTDFLTRLTSSPPHTWNLTAHISRRVLNISVYFTTTA